MGGVITSSNCCSSSEETVVPLLSRAVLWSWDSLIRVYSLVWGVGLRDVCPENDGVGLSDLWDVNEEDGVVSLCAGRSGVAGLEL